MELGPLVVTKGSLPTVRRYRGDCELCGPHESHLPGSCYEQVGERIKLLCGCGMLDGLDWGDGD